MTAVVEVPPPTNEAVIECLGKILRLEPDQSGRDEAIRIALGLIRVAFKADGVQIVEVLARWGEEWLFKKHFLEEEKPRTFQATSGVNRFCISTRRFVLVSTVDHEARMAHGVSGLADDITEIQRLQLPYVLAPPDKDEESVIFFPLLRGVDCAAVIKICDFGRSGRFGLDHVRSLRPIADAIANVLLLWDKVEALHQQNSEFDTLLAEAMETVAKLQVGERLSYQFLTATSHLHELAGILGGMSSDREEFQARIGILGIPVSTKVSLLDILDRYAEHRKQAYEKVRQLLSDRPKKEALSKKPSNIRELISEQLSIYSAALKRDEILLRKSLRAADRKLVVDAPAIKYVFRILLNNAVYAVNARGKRPKRIELRAVERDGWLELRIRDTGSGISRKDQGKIFDAFFTTKQDGTGIGLYWAKQSIEVDHGGSIMLERSLPGGGSTFLVRLKLWEGA